MLNVLVTGVGGGVGQGIVKSLRLIDDLDIRVVTSDMSELASGLYGGDYSYIIPAASSEDYFSEIQKICIKEEIDYYFPGTDVELLCCAKIKADFEFRVGVKIIVSPENAVEIADDKYATFEFLKLNGFECPETYLEDEIDFKSLLYPVIVKPRIGYRSIGVSLVASESEARSALLSIKDGIVQEYLDGDEFTCTVAIRNNCVSDVLCLRRDLRSGDTYRAWPVSNKVVETYVKKVALKIGVDGSCNFQLRLVDGVPKIFEINARFSGTTPFCSYLGFNPVEFCLKSDLKILYNYKIDYSKVVVRHWSEIVVEESELNQLKKNKAGKVVASNVSRMT